MKRRNFIKTAGITALSMRVGNELLAAEAFPVKGFFPDNKGEKRDVETLQSPSIRAYNYSPDLKPSQRYTLKAGALSVLVMDTPIPAAFAAFETDGVTDIEIECTIDVKWVEIRPLKAGIKPKIDDGKIVFTIPAPGNYSVEINDQIDYPLFLFVNPIEVKPSKSDPNVIFFEAGKIHKPGVIRPKSNQHVFIEGGAVVIGAIAATDVEHVKVSGYGILDGSYNNPQRISDGLVKPWLPEHGYTIPDRASWFISFRNSQNITIEGLMLINGSQWQVVPVNCDHVTIKGLKLVADNPNDDGIDIVRSRKVRITDSFIRTKDDCVVIKSFQNYPDSVIVDDVIVEKCVFWNAAWGNGLEIGFELIGDVKNVVFRDCDIIHVEAGAVLSIHNSDKATVSNVLYENIRVEEARQKLIDLGIFRSVYSTDGRRDTVSPSVPLLGARGGVLVIPPENRAYHAQFRGKIENIHFKDIAVEGRFPFSIITGFDESHKVSNITFTNITANGKKIQSLEALKLCAELVENITIQ